MVGFKGWLLQQLGCLNDINWISPKKGLTHPQNFFRFKDRYFSVIMILFYSQLNTNEPSSFNFFLNISLVLYKLYIVWCRCHCWCIIEQHFVCCSRDWWYRFIRKVGLAVFFIFGRHSMTALRSSGEICLLCLYLHNNGNPEKDLYSTSVHLHWSVWNRFPFMVVYLP